MLYFSKLKLIFLYVTIFILIGFSSLNIFDFNEDSFLKKKVNLGLDLRGGSYLLLEIDTAPIIEQKLQNKLIIFRSYFKKNKYKYSNLRVVNNKLIFELSLDKIENFKKYLEKKDNELNLFYNNYSSFELDFNVKNNVQAPIKKGQNTCLK